MIPPSDLELLDDRGRLSEDKELPWAARAVVISSERPACGTVAIAPLEGLILPSAFVSGRKEGFPEASEELWLSLAV